MRKCSFCLPQMLSHKNPTTNWTIKWSQRNQSRAVIKKIYHRKFNLCKKNETNAHSGRWKAAEDVFSIEIKFKDRFNSRQTFFHVWQKNEQREALWKRMKWKWKHVLWQIYMIQFSWFEHVKTFMSWMQVFSCDKLGYSLFERTNTLTDRDI